MKIALALADLAVTALLKEARLTPKPALVDSRGSGAHTDLSLDLMCRSAWSLRPTFLALARAAHGCRPDQALRERLGAIGRDGERTMLRVTGGVNTHRGALWALGLLVASAAVGRSMEPAALVAERAGAIARYPDRRAPTLLYRSHGAHMRERYGAAGARGEAANGFPHVVEAGLPTLHRARARGVPEQWARLDALLAIMATVEDTCLLYRGGVAALDLARDGARGILEVGGTSTTWGAAALCRLEQALLACHASPGGSADLLAATLFLDRVERITVATEITEV